jgi:hypothetical protein
MRDAVGAAGLAAAAVDAGKPLNNRSQAAD